MGVQTFTQPDYSDPSQSGSEYPTNIDKAIAVFKRLAGWFAPHQVVSGSPAPDLAVAIDAGWVLNSTTLTEVAAQTVGGFTIPSSGQHRIDRVVIDATTGVATRVAGTAATGSPSAVAPDIPAGKLPCCQVLLTSSDTAILNSMITDERALGGGSGGGITLGTEQATTSGTSIDFTGIPAGTKRIVIMFDAVSTSGTSNIIVQIGDAGGVENTGYNSGCQAVGTSTATSTAGFVLTPSDVNSGNVFRGAVTLELEDSANFTWVCRGHLWQSGANTLPTAVGVKALTAELDRVRITTAGGTDTFDAGAINISYQ